MDVQVDLCWSEGEPSMTVTELASGLHGVVDARLSESQVSRACAELGDAGDAVLQAWRDRVGLSERSPAI